MSQNQLDKYFKDSIELIFNNSKDYFKDDEMTEEEYKNCVGDILKTFVNKFHTYQSQLLFSSISDVNLNFKKDEPKLDKNDYDTDNILNDISVQNELNPNVEPNWLKLSSSPPNLPGFNVNDILNQYQNESENESEPEEISGSYSSEPEFETQCCSRIGDKWYKIDDYSSEFLDKYPAGVYITTDGYVIGSPCHNMIPDEEFDEGNIYCEEHVMKGNNDDIREQPVFLKGMALVDL